MELVKMIRNNVIRMVPIDAVALREAEGYKKESEEPQTPSNPPANDEGGKLDTDEGEGSQNGNTGDGDGTQTPDGNDGEGEGSQTPDGNDGEGEGSQTPDGNDGEGEGSQTPDGNDGEGEGIQTPEDKFTEEELKEKSINDLRKIAKNSGIVGFMNMSKETLVGIIVASQE